MSELESLRSISARIGRDPLLVQAATGNTSIKVDGVLWIKASGTWLANAATDEIMIPVNLAETRRKIERDIDPAGQMVVVDGKPLGTSVETKRGSFRNPTFDRGSDSLFRYQICEIIARRNDFNRFQRLQRR